MGFIQGDGVYAGIQALCIQYGFDLEWGQHLCANLILRSGREEIDVDLASFNRLFAAADRLARIWHVSLDKQDISIVLPDEQIEAVVELEVKRLMLQVYLVRMDAIPTEVPQFQSAEIHAPSPIPPNRPCVRRPILRLPSCLPISTSHLGFESQRWPSRWGPAPASPTIE